MILYQKAILKILLLAITDSILIVLILFHFSNILIFKILMVNWYKSIVTMNIGKEYDMVSQCGLNQILNNIL